MQTDLFGKLDPTSRELALIQAAKVKGLELHFDFITESEELGLIEKIDKSPWITDLSRRVQHYGYRYDYKSRKLDKSFYLGTLPQWLEALSERLMNYALIDFIPDQVIINEYKPGQGIAPHIDCEPCFEDTITSLSLGSTCMMNFERSPNHKDKVGIILEPRSLMVMKGESRYHWYHGIPHRKKDTIYGQEFLRKRRISITFRKVVL